MRNPRLVLVLTGWLLVPAALAAAEAPARHPDDLVYPPLPVAELPQPQRFTLDNGLVVLIVEDHELPLVEAQALIRTGSRLEPANRVGLASLTGAVMRSGGTASIPSDQLDERLEALAASIETGIGTSSGQASMSCLSENFAEVLAVLADVLRHPAFEQEKIEVVKSQIRSVIARQNDNPGQILAREFREIIYGQGSPYARAETYETLDAIERGDLVAWHAAAFHPNNVILGLVGDLDTKRALEEVKAAFGDWPRGPEASIEVPFSAAAEPGVYVVEKDDVNQSSIRIGHLGMRRDAEDYYAVEVMNQVLSGAYGSRLFTNVRTRKGLAYGVFGSVQSQWDYPGMFLMSMTTKAETTGAGIAALLEEADSIRTTAPPTAEEVAAAKEGILASFVFTADSADEILGQQLAYAYYGYPSDWLERYRAGIEKVTVEEVHRAAVDRIDPRRFAILVVGPTAGLDRPLSDFGTVQTVDITIPEPPVAAVAETAESKARGAALIARAAAAMGGERLDALTSLRLEAHIELHTPQGSRSLQSTTVIAYPDRQHQTLELPFGTVVRVLDGERAWMSSPQGTQALPAAQRDDLATSFNRHLVALLRQRGAAGFSAVAAGSEQLEGSELERVQVRLDGALTTLGIDPESGLVRTVAFRGTNPAGVPGQLHLVHTDFRPVEGLTLSFAAETTFDGEPMVRATIAAIDVDVEVDPALFVMPE